MKLRALVLCGAMLLSGSILSNQKNPYSHDSNLYENELFDFETGASDDSDFFLFQETDAVEEQNNQSRITRIKQWFVDQYNYFLLRCFIFYIDLKDKKTLYTSLLKSYYQSMYKKIQRYFNPSRKKRYLP
jgi:hypothetical protein